MDARSVRLVSWSEDFRWLIFLVEGKTTAGSYYLLDVESGEPRLLADQRPKLRHSSIATTAFMQFPTRDGYELPLTVLTPHTMTDTREADIVVVADSFPSGFPGWEFDWLAQSIADAGYVVIKPAFRGAGWDSGVSDESPYPLWMANAQKDIDDAVQFAVEQGFGRSDTVCVVGRNFGGYAALAVGAFSDRPYRCLVSINGVSDVREFGEVHRRDAGTGRAFAFKPELITGLGSDYRTEARDVEASPIRYVEDFAAPVLLVSTAPNSWIRPRQSKRMHRALRKAGKDSSILEIRPSDIWLSDAEARLKLIEALRKFLERS
ncbi:MAG: prolyl oligopeptidase family serine peptidase [Pseudomonadota bacterium]